MGRVSRRRTVLRQRRSKRMEGVVPEPAIPTALCTLLVRLLGYRSLMKLSSKFLVDPLAESLLDKVAGVTARWSGETLGSDRGLALGTDDDLELSIHVPLPTWIVSLIEPSCSVASVKLCPPRRASIFAFSTAYS